MLLWDMSMVRRLGRLKAAGDTVWMLLWERLRCCSPGNVTNTEQGQYLARFHPKVRNH